MAVTNPRLLSDPQRPKPAPPEYAGQWVAWDHERSRIVAHGTTLQEVWNAAAQTGVADPVYERVRRADELILGRV